MLELDSVVTSTPHAACMSDSVGLVGIEPKTISRPSSVARSLFREFRLG